MVNEGCVEMDEKQYVNEENSSPLSSASALPQGFSQDEDGNTYPEGGFHAWLSCFGSFCSMFAGFGVVNTIGPLSAYVTENQLSNYSDSEISWIFGIYVFLVFFCGLQIGPIFDSRGPTALIVIGGVCVVVSTFVLGLCKEYYQFILAFSLLSGTGSSLLFTPAVAAVSHWFYKRRGLATGLAATGGSFGGIIFPLMLQKLFKDVGWAWGTRVLGFILVLLCTLAVLLTRSRLSAVDRAKAAAKAGSTIHVAGTDFKAMLPDPGIFFKQRGHVFIVAWATFFLEWGLFVPVTYLPQYATSTGSISPAFAFQLISILNAGSLFGRAVPGLVADHLGRFNTIIITTLMCFFSVFAFWLPACLLDDSHATARLGLVIVFAVIFGFASGSNISLTPICVGQLCDTKEYGKYYATCYTLVSFGTLTGIPIAGSLISVTAGPPEQSYWGVILFTGLCYLASVLCFAYVRIARIGWKLSAVW